MSVKFTSVSSFRVSNFFPGKFGSVKALRNLSNAVKNDKPLKPIVNYLN